MALVCPGGSSHEFIINHMYDDNNKFISKWIFDIDERAKLSKQTLPEFLFDYYLNVFGEPQLAEEALVIIVANVRTYDTTSPRAWMFSRFLRSLCVCACVPACVRACTLVYACVLAGFY
jgi:hypothetical protein